MDFKKLKKSSSKKLIKGGLGFFLSPRDESKDEGTQNSSRNIATIKKFNNWGDNESLKFDQNESEPENRNFIDDIPVIPSLDDFVDDDLANQVAKAPLVGIKKVATYKELENDILKHSAFSSLEEVNLQILIKLLHPETCLEEPDVPWTKDDLFSEMVSVINDRKIQK